MKIKLLTILLLFVSLISINVAAQNRECGTVVTPQQVAFEMQQLGLRRLITQKVNRTLSIHAYIVLDSLGNPNVSEQDILDAIQRVNGNFAPICMSFKVCEFTYIPNFQFDVFIDTVHEDKIVALDFQPNVINMYFVDSLFSSSEAGGWVNGYAYFPGGRDLVMMRKSALEGLTMEHELGHFFGLYHTFETSFGVENIPRDNCTMAGDLLCDTEADPGGNEDNLDINCEYDPNPGFPGNWFLPPTDNIMSYYGDCRCIFTPDQYNRMADQYLNNRNYLW